MAISVGEGEIDGQRIEITGLKEVIAALKNWNQQKQIGLQDIVRREIEPMLEGYAKATPVEG